MTEPDRCRIEVTVDGPPDHRTAAAVIGGEFDRLQVPTFDQALTVLPDRLSELTVDLTQTTIIDSAALGALIRLERSIGPGCRLRVLVREPFQVTVMDVTGLTDLLYVERV